MIYYFCPPTKLLSSGVRLLHRHVAILHRHGLPASLLLPESGDPPLTNTPGVPVVYSSRASFFRWGDVVVVPEGCPRVMNALRRLPLKRVALALSWKYVYQMLPDGVDWRRFRMHAVLTNSGFIGDFIHWAMRLPVHLFVTGIDPDLYFQEPARKLPQIVYIARKSLLSVELRRILGSRHRAYAEGVTWKPLSGLAEEDYAREVRHSRIFLNLSQAEGFPLSLLEAMRSETLVAGYHSVGGQRELVGEGPRQNCILAENLDYVTLARKLEPVLASVLSGDMAPWDFVTRNGVESSKAYTPEAEEDSVLNAWHQILGS